MAFKLKLSSRLIWPIPLSVQLPGRSEGTVDLTIFYMVTNIFTAMTIIDPFKINRPTQVMNRCITVRSLHGLHVSLSGPVSSAESFRQCQNKLSCSEHCQQGRIIEFYDP